jgi:hypothetical protein
MITPEKRAAALIIFQAAHEGKTCQTRAFGQGPNGPFEIADPWEHAEDVMERPQHWRIKPEPVTQWWSRESHVPAELCWVGKPDVDSKENHGSIVIAVDGDGVTLAGGDRVSHFSWDKIKRNNLVYSLDRKTWHPCTVTEEVR